MPERRPVLVRPGEGRSVWSLGGRFTVKLDDAGSAGRFSIVEALALRATEPPLHIHHREDEAWYVLDGRMTFYVGDDQLTATSGAFVLAPMGLPHTFTVDVEPSRVLVFATLAGSSTSRSSSGARRPPTCRPPTSPFLDPTCSDRSPSGTGSRWSGRLGARRIPESRGRAAAAVEQHHRVTVRRQNGARHAPDGGTARSVSGPAGPDTVGLQRGPVAPGARIPVSVGTQTGERRCR